MSIYARVQDGVVMEIIQPLTYDADSLQGINPSWKRGDEIPIGSRYTAELVATMVDITSVTPQPKQDWTYGAQGFAPPA